ncbi:MAG TPA: enoyl-CoA hydratase/isomerase family protein [Bacteroidales bacterium]|nr:enoyl-CoA hydratase/isomerase family protein [Bacteroidales bacterium]
MKHPDYKSILVIQQGKQCEILLNRPERKNAINLEMLQELDFAFEWLMQDNEINVVLLKSPDPEIFSAGGDLTDIASVSPDDAYNLGLRVQSVFSKLTKLPQIVVACMRGKVIGGGAELCLYADFRIAHENMTLMLPELRHGMIPGAGGISLLSRIAGIGDTLFLLAGGTSFSADDALRTGIVQHVADNQHYDEFVSRTASFMMETEREVAATAKHIAWSNLNRSIGECLCMESQEFGSLLNRFGRDKIIEFMNSKKAKKTS